MSERHRKILKEDAPERPTRESLEEFQFLHEARRNESSRNHIHTAMLVVLWGVIGAFLVSGLTWLYHQLSPVGWHYLPDEQVAYLGTISF